MWWRQPKVYLRVIIYLAIIGLVWFKLMPVLRVGKVPVEADLSDMVEGYSHDGAKAETGMKYVSIGFILRATDKGELRLNEKRFRLVDRSGRAFEPVEGSLNLLDSAGNDWRFAEGDVCAGRVVFLVSEEAQPARLSINPPRKSRHRDGD